MRIATVVGARPQFIKAAVVSRAICQRPGMSETILHTGQHYDHGMSDIFFRQMHIPEPALNLGVGGLSHGAATGRMLEGLEAELQRLDPDMVLVYGDTSSTLAGALAAAKLHLPVAHVEAGLRSFNRDMPEEINRVLTDHVSTLLLCPTQTAMDNLRREGIGLDPAPSHAPQAHLVGDVMYDAALFYRSLAPREPASILPAREAVDRAGGFALCTLHRQENTDFRDRLAGILAALDDIGRSLPVVLPLHPRTAKRLAEFGLEPGPNLWPVPPTDYFEMLALLGSCSLVVTDSGGLQKEAFFFGKPCVVLREQTEWVELVRGGFSVLAGWDPGAIRQAFAAMAGKTIATSEIFGSGDAGQRIADILAGWLER